MGTQHVDDYDYQAYHDDEQRANMEHVTAESLKGAICAEFVEEYFKCPVCLDILIEVCKNKLKSAYLIKRIFFLLIA